MKIKFKNIKDRVVEREQKGLAQYHQKYGGQASLRLLALKSKLNRRSV
jgi:hypothetical protein